MFIVMRGSSVISAHHSVSTLMRRERRGPTFFNCSSIRVQLLREQRNTPSSSEGVIH